MGISLLNEHYGFFGVPVSILRSSTATEDVLRSERCAPPSRFRAQGAADNIGIEAVGKIFASSGALLKQSDPSASGIHSLRTG